jgi:hypothetical protein
LAIEIIIAIWTVIELTHPYVDEKGFVSVCKHIFLEAKKVKMNLIPLNFFKE